MASGMAITTDLSHLPPDGTKGIPKTLRQRAAFTREVVEAATSVRAGASWLSSAGCIEQDADRICGGFIRVEHADASRRIQWECCACGSCGVITGFEGSESDFRSFIPRSRVVTWGFDAFQGRLLREATRWIPALRAVVSRAMPVDEESDELLLLRATVDELDSIYTLVEELTDATRSSERLDLLDDLRASLCTSMDGF